MATNNIINTALSGSTGTGSFCGATQPILITPIMGAINNNSSLTFSSTSGIIGSTTNDSAAAGSVGEIIIASIPVASAVALTTGTVTEVTHITLGAGDWDIFANVGFTGGATTLVKYVSGWPNSSVASINTTFMDLFAFETAGVAAFATGNISFSVNQSGALRQAGSSTVYLLARSVFTISTCSAYGYIYARRIR